MISGSFLIAFHDVWKRLETSHQSVNRSYFLVKIISTQNTLNDNQLVASTYQNFAYHFLWTASIWHLRILSILITSHVLASHAAYSLVGGIGALFVCCIVVSRYYTGGYSSVEDYSR